MLQDQTRATGRAEHPEDQSIPSPWSTPLVRTLKHSPLRLRPEPHEDDQRYATGPDAQRHRPAE